MDRVYLQRVHPINRKQRLLEYIKAQESVEPEVTDIEKEIEVAFEELIEEPEDSTNEFNIDLGLKSNIHQTEDISSPPAKRQRTSQFQIPDLETYSEKFRSVVEQAMMFNQQLNDITNQGITVCEDADVSVDDVQPSVERENSPVKEKKQASPKLDNKTPKKIIHITGDHTLEYYEDEGIDDDSIATDDSQKENIPESKKTSKKASTKFIHITGDCSSQDFENHQISLLGGDSNQSIEPYPCSASNNPDHIIIGPNGTAVNKYNFNKIDWRLPAAIVTRKLLLNIFGREILSTHSLTGKPSPAFLNVNKPLKKPLDAEKVADIIYIVTRKKNVKAKEVRLAITSKCADEQKMLKARMSK